ncbi:FAD-dependent oxidoreductase [Azospirillum sp. 412522]|nr:FAD-dependent oxidoreductase [Azospirillum sp. 412522]MBY6262093.1 FAD-dependent oxidoreductase [Azospirillum sp. 412522]
MSGGDQAWDTDVDVLVVGSGAGGLLAAVFAAHHHAKVLVIEKSDEYGGTSATSGGGVWIPNSPLAPPDLHQDSPDDAFRYIRALSDASVPDENIRAYVQWAPEMLRWLTDNTPVRYTSQPYIDYHAEVPGGKLGYRTHLPEPMDGRLLGPDMLDLRSTSPAASLFGVINWQLSETFALLFRPKGWVRTAARMVARYYGDLPHRFRSRKDRFLTLGTALVGGLRLAAKQRGIPLWLRTGLLELVAEEGRVVGAVVQQDGRKLRIRARRGVVLAAGGFERNREMRLQHMPAVPVPTVSGSQENNTGDSIRAAAAIGAATMNLHMAWWAPVFSIPGESRGRLSTIERALPGSILVNQAGRRYLNEAASYHVVGRQMIDADRPDARTNPSWLVFDATYRRSYPVGPILPLVPDWALSAPLRSVLKKATTLDGLARAIGVPAATLRETVGRFNTGARQGIDPEFGRGAQAYDRMFGDQRVQPNPSLGPIETAPFYAIPMHAGDIGTCGGLKTNADAQVLGMDGLPIAGLYAVGNNAASVMGGSYPGAGSTLGPSMTFGFVAARHVTGANVPA